MTATETYIYLVACSLNKIKAELKDADIEALYDTAKSHLQTAVIAKALEDCEAFKNADESIKNKWINTLNTSVKRTMLFEAERRTVERFMEDNGIWHCPMKGVVINPFYPSYGTREYSDYDYLYDPEASERFKEYMLGRGYTFKGSDYIVDSFIKEPYFNFEMHRELFRLDKEGQYNFYYKNVRERLVKDEDNGFGYHFSDSDNYIYFILHAFKHYKEEGTGFRTVADEYAVLKHGNWDLDFEYIKKELKELKADEFEEMLRNISLKLLSDPSKTVEALAELNENETEFIDFVFSCGAYGHGINYYRTKFKNTVSENDSTAKYYFKRIIPDIERYKYNHPFIYKHRFFYPFFCIYRIVVYPFTHRDNLKNEIKAVNAIKEEQKQKLKQ